MAEIARLSAVITANTTQFTRAMKQADASVKGTAAGMGKLQTASAASATSIDRVGKSSRSAALGLKLMKVGLAGMAVAAYVGFKEMKAGEQVSAKTRNTLQNVGNSAGFTVKKIEDLSASLAMQTGIQDEVIQGAANLLLGFKDIGNNASVFDKVLAASMDRAAKTGRDLTTTTRAIGFAYQSPISGVGMLRRAGILLTKDTQKQIKTLEEDGKLQEARALLLDKVASSAKGAAKQLGQTSTGQVNRLREAFNQMSEEVARAVLPTILAVGPSVISLMKSAAPAFKAIGEAIKSVADVLGPMLKGVLGNTAALKALTVAAIAFISIGLANKVLAMGAAFRVAATGAAAAGTATKALTVGAAASGLAGMVANVGRVGAAYAGAAVGVGKFAQTDPFAKHVAGVGRFSKASAFAKTSLGALGAGLPFGPLGMLTTAVVGGVAALFLLADRTGYATRQAQALTDASNNTANSLRQVTGAVQAETQALLELSSSNADVTQKATAAAVAEKAYNAALQQGARAGETAAQYQARINGLRQRAVATSTAAQAAEANNAQKIKSTVAGLETLTSAYGKNKSALQGQAATAKQMGQNVFATQKNREQAARDLLSAEGALSRLDKQRPAELKNIISQTKIASAAVRGSAMSDGEKVAALDKIKGIAAKAQSELNKISQTKAKAKVEPPDKTAQDRLKEIRREFNLLPTEPKVMRVITDYSTRGKPPGGYRGGYVAGFAGGGVVRGPGGRDVIPAMLTAGEVVLTKQQQRLVNGGMSISDAIRRTGGAFAKGGAVDASYAKGLKRRKNETAEQFKQRKADTIQQRKDAAKQRRSTAVGRFAQNVANIQGRAISEKYQGGRSGIGLMESTRRAQEQNITNMESAFKGTATNIGQGISDFSGSFKDFDKFQTQSNRAWERGWKGTITLIDGSTFTGGLADFDKKVESGRKAIEQQYSALTVSEQALKSLNEEAAAADLAGNIQDAQKAYNLALQFGNAKEIADAQKALGRAELEQRRADLEGKAKTEREQADAAKATALTALEENAATERQMLQDKFDDERALREQAFADARAQLQGQLDAQLQQQRDKDAMALAELSFQQEQEQAALDRRIAALTEHYDNAGVIQRDALNAQVANLNANSKAMEESGTTLAFAFSQGMKKGSPHIKSALKGIANLVKDYLKLNSPAKKGPLSTLDHWFDALGPTLASGVDTSAIEGTLNSMAPGRRGGGGGGVTINLTVNDSTFAGMSRDQADRVAREIQAAITRQVSLGV